MSYLIVINTTPNMAIVIEHILNIEIFSLSINHEKNVIKITEVCPIILATGGFSILA